MYIKIIHTLRVTLLWGHSNIKYVVKCEKVLSLFLPPPAGQRCLNTSTYSSSREMTTMRLRVCDFGGRRWGGEGDYQQLLSFLCLHPSPFSSSSSSFFHTSNPVPLQNKAGHLAHGWSQSALSAKWIHRSELGIGSIFHLTSDPQILWCGCFEGLLDYRAAVFLLHAR